MKNEGLNIMLEDLGIFISGIESKVVKETQMIGLFGEEEEITVMKKIVFQINGELSGHTNSKILFETFFGESE